MQDILTFISTPDIHHLPAVLVIGIAIFFGTVGARIFQKLQFPQVVGYIIIGILIGKSGLQLFDEQTAQSLSGFNMFALGIIGFMIGGELKIDIFRQFGKQFVIILLSEGLFSFFVVTTLITTLSYFIFHNIYAALGLGLMLGAISSATAPAATVDVIWEYKARGILSKSILAIVALDDGLALLIFGFASSAATALTGTGHESMLKTIGMPLYEIFGAVALGVITAIVLVFALKLINEQDKVLTFTLASVLLIIGLSIALKVESILASMVLGATVANLRPRRSQRTFELLEKFAPPIYVLFFVLVGARLQLRSMPMWIALLGIVYIIGRSSGKILGAWFGAKISKSAPAVQKYLGICLFSQAGVAVGLAILASQKFTQPISETMTLGEAIILVITATTFIVQLVGPPCVKYGLKKAGEIGLNITDQDLIKTYKVSDVLDSDPPTIKTNTPLQEILDTFSDTDHLHYPVVDDDKNLQGLITVEGIRKTFAHRDSLPWLLAHDIMEPVLDTITPQTPLEDVMENMKRYDLEHVCVVDEKEKSKLLGVIHLQTVNRKISAEVLHRQNLADQSHLIKTA